jgi:hypothetical protein
MERLQELMAKKENADILGSEFVSGLEKRRDLLESRSYKALAIQAPLFLMLAFALLNLDVQVSILGLSTASAKSLREVLLVVSTAFSLGLSAFGRQLQNVNEMLKAVVAKVGGSNSDLREFLQVRYGLGEFSFLSSFNDEFKVGTTQWVLISFAAFGASLLVVVLFVVAFAIQLLTFREIYLHPNYSVEVSMAVIALVLLGDVVSVLMSLLTRGYQPYQTFEDFLKLNKLAQKDPEQYSAIIREIVQRHYSKGLIRRVFGRPKMKRMP